MPIANEGKYIPLSFVQSCHDCYDDPQCLSPVAIVLSTSLLVSFLPIPSRIIQSSTMLALLLLLAFWAAYSMAQQTLSSAANVTGMNLSGLPKCAQDCLGDAAAVQAQGGCSAIDIKCLCSNVQYVNVLACCLDTKCSPEDQKKAVTFNSNLCQRVNITIPNFLGCAPGSNPFSNSTTTADAKDSTTPVSGSGLSTGAKAGIGAGVGIVGLIAAASAIALIALRKRQRDNETRFSSMQYQPPSFMGPTELKRGSMATTTAPPYGPPYSVASYGSDQLQPPQEISELPSPLASAQLPPRPEDRPPLTQSDLWFPGATMAAAAANGGDIPPNRKQPVMEMPGDTDINQYHPAMSAAGNTTEDVISPVSDRGHETHMSLVSNTSADAHATNVEGPVTPFLQGGREEDGGERRPVVGRVRSSVNLIDDASKGSAGGGEPERQPSRGF